MNHLDHQDLLILISALDDLHSDNDPKTLSRRTITATSKVIAAADSVAFTGFRYDSQYANLTWHNGGDYAAEEMEVFAAYVHENPLFDAIILNRRTDTLQITDITPPEEFERTTLYNEFYRRVGVSNQLVTPMRINEDLLITCSINIGKGDFSVRDKEILTLLSPHLAGAIRNAFAYQRLSGALETEACGIIALDKHGKPVFISDFARQLFAGYFAGEKYRADGLPETLSDWIKQLSRSERANEFAAPPPALKISGQRGNLTVRLALNKQTDEQTLMLEEQRFAMHHDFTKFGLTRRESEIMHWITQGKSDEVIARLCGISPRTVHKHVEHIYEKFGVETRTGAMLRALELLKS